ncbi:hypothetical protein CDAR_570861 [Caerostris darwini]|uniref:Uncharacterized protein n=1 Tax=Caerostris darwini TaxID=1538125 RepID=A0AAV4QCV3_9ARAC|nr:hypothetical protein CDAR_570861 [Caerostris darwini]
MLQKKNINLPPPTIFHQSSWSGNDRGGNHGKRWQQVRRSVDQNLLFRKRDSANRECGRSKNWCASANHPPTPKLWDQVEEKRSQSVNELRANHSEMSTEKPFQDCKSGFTKRLRGRKKEKKSLQKQRIIFALLHTRQVFLICHGFFSCETDWVEMGEQLPEEDF